MQYDHPQPEKSILSKCQILRNICNKENCESMDYYQIITGNNISKLLMEFKFNFTWKKDDTISDPKLLTIWLDNNLQRLDNN